MTDLFPLNPMRHFKRQYEIEKERVMAAVKTCEVCGIMIDYGRWCDVSCANDAELDLLENVISKGN